MSDEIQRTISPVDGRVYVERPVATASDVENALAKATASQRHWRTLGVEARATMVSRFVDAMLDHEDEIATELTWQMGRPIAHSPGELRGFEERARYMISIAEESLADIHVGQDPGVERFIRREPVGVVFVVAPWNYPFLTAVNAVVPALLAGNSVLLKHSSQTPLVAERFSRAGREAQIPEGVLQHLHMGHGDVAKMVADARVGFVAFTGSVPGGHAIVRAAVDRFIATGLELGGKDPAYVRADANLRPTVETLVDGAFYNAGQSCCGIERIYVHARVYDEFVSRYAELTRGYVLGSPLDPRTTLGPVVRREAAASIRAQIAAACASGAVGLIDTTDFSLDDGETPYMAPQVLVNVDHTMGIMTEETFGPAVGIMKVDSDEEAITLMNDSIFGLTASVFTEDPEAALHIGNQIETGTWFMNRCDYLDPALAWTGVKDSGRGCTLSALGYEALTRPKSYHLRKKWP